MPNTKSAKKDMKKSAERRAINRAGRSLLRSTIRKTRAAIAAGDAAKAAETFPLTTKKLDQAAAKGLIHKNTAARHKSRLSAHIKNLKTAKASA
ncbi:MAG TPA: 30S ribosomal protein S20 [Pirellulales bacterium]